MARAKSRRRLSVMLPALCIMGVALVLRLYRMDAHGLFIDEIFSVTVMRGTADPQLIAFDSMRPLYFLLLKAWTFFGTSETWMRMFSAVFGVLNVGLVGWLGSLLGGRRTGLIAALLAALAPLEIVQSQQLRMYTLGTCFLLLGSIFLVKALDKTKSAWLFAWVAARVCMVLTLPLTALIMFSDVIAVWHNRVNRQFARVFVGALILWTVAWSPFLLKVLAAAKMPYDAWREYIPSPILSEILSFIIQFTCFPGPFQEYEGSLANNTIAGIYVLFVAPVILAISVAACYFKPKLRYAVFALLPLVIMFLWSQVASPLLVTRYVLFNAPFVYILASVGFCEVWNRFRLLAAGVALIYAFMVSSHIVYVHTHLMQEDWRSILTYVKTHQRPDDKVFIWNYHVKYSMSYYYDGPSKIADMDVTWDDEKNIHVNLKPYVASGAAQRFWLITRVVHPGWTEFYRGYNKYKTHVLQEFNVLDYRQVGLADVFLVTLKETR